MVYDPLGNSATAIFSITVTDSILPEISHPDDVEYTAGEEDYDLTIEWTATDHHPHEYVAYRNGVIFSSGPWGSGSPIELSIINWAEGVYNVTIVVTDYGGNSVSDEVIVTVNPYSEPVETSTTTTTSTETTTPIFDSGMILGIAAGAVALVIILVIILKKRGGR